jgi:predicted DNA-binding transcriptional regulator AlpA
MRQSEKQTQSLREPDVYSETQEPILRESDVLFELKFSRSTLYRWIKIGRFPKSKQYGLQMVGWTRSEVTAFRVKHGIAD